MSLLEPTMQLRLIEQQTITYGAQPLCHKLDVNSKDKHKILFVLEAYMRRAKVQNVPPQQDEAVYAHQL